MFFTQNMGLNLTANNKMPPTGCLAYSRGTLLTSVKIQHDWTLQLASPSSQKYVFSFPKCMLLLHTTADITFQCIIDLALSLTLRVFQLGALDKLQE